ncbi:hypothetical protein CBL_12435 [Carabus blaptoides fortunei]
MHRGPSLSGAAGSQRFHSPCLRLHFILVLERQGSELNIKAERIVASRWHTKDQTKSSYSLRRSPVRTNFMTTSFSTKQMLLALCRSLLIPIRWNVKPYCTPAHVKGKLRRVVQTDERDSKLGDKLVYNGDRNTVVWCKIVQGGISSEASDMEFTITKCVNEIEYPESVDGRQAEKGSGLGSGHRTTRNEVKNERCTKDSWKFNLQTGHGSNLIGPHRFNDSNVLESVRFSSLSLYVLKL